MKTQAIKINPEILKWARKSGYFTQSALAVKIGISIEQYREWEAGMSCPTRSELLRLALALKRPLMIFLCAGILNP